VATRSARQVNLSICSGIHRRNANGSGRYFLANLQPASFAVICNRNVARRRTSGAMGLRLQGSPGVRQRPNPHLLSLSTQMKGHKSIGEGVRIVLPFTAHPVQFAVNCAFHARKSLVAPCTSTMGAPLPASR
jgi:hypothetical protein